MYNSPTRFFADFRSLTFIIACATICTIFGGKLRFLAIPALKTIQEAKKTNFGNPQKNHFMYTTLRKTLVTRRKTLVTRRKTILYTQPSEKLW
jgi:hypothetical protein